MTSTVEISQNLIIKAIQEQLSSEVSGEAVILELNSGVYYGLNETGAIIWQWLQEPKKVSEIRTLILTEYDVEPEKCDRDLEAILKEMLAAGLIEIVNE
jgi:hypothetical protein